MKRTKLSFAFNRLTKTKTTNTLSPPVTETLASKDDSFVTKILLQIFNNVQVRIENVHVRLEDCISNASTPFAVGVSFSNLVFVTPDAKEKQKFSLKNASSGIFKIAMLSNFGLYFNCYSKASYHGDFLSTSSDYASINARMKEQIAISDSHKPVDTDWVLQPINFQSKVFIHRKPHEDNYEIPSADVELALDKFALDLNRKQFETLVVVVDNVNRLSVAVAYRKWRPEPAVKGNAKLWWQFAITCILETDVRRKQRNWSWPHIRDHVNKRKKYKELYKKKLLSPDKTRENLENLLQKYEDEFDVLNLTIVRNQAKLETKDQLEAIKKEKQKRKVQENEQKSSGGWFGGWWSSSKTADVDEDEPDAGPTKKMNLIEEVKREFRDETEKAKLYSAINYDESSVQDLTYPLGYKAQQLSFVIGAINLNITDKLQNVKISEFFLNEVKLSLSVLPTSNGLDLALSINTMKVFGVRDKKTPFIEPIITEKSKNILEVDFVLNPIKTELKYDFGVKIQAQGLKMIYDKETVDRMVEMLTVTQEVSIDEIQTIAALKLNEFKNRSAISLEQAIENHKKLNLSLNIEPSFILVPETGSIESAKHILLVSLGHFEITSKLADFNKNQLQEILTNTTKAKLDLVRKSAYENYMLSISKVQLILSDKQNWLEDIDQAHNQKLPSEPRNKRNLIYPISLNLVLSRCIIMDDPDMALLKVDAKIPDIRFIVEQTQILDLLRLLFSIVPVADLAADTVDSVKKLKEEKPKFTPIKSRTQEEYQSNVIAAVAERPAITKQQVLNQVKLQAEFTINTLVIELRSKENTIVRGLMGELFTEFRQTDERMTLGMNLDSIQFFACMNYYPCINEIQTEVMQMINREAPNAIKDLQDTYASRSNQQQAEKKKKTKKELAVAKKPNDQITQVTLNMGRVDFIMLEDFKLENGAAVIFNMQLQMTFQQINERMGVNLSLNNIQMAITELNSYLMNSYVALFILKPCELLCNVSMEGETQNISVAIEEVVLSISPNMVQILMTMLGKLGGSNKIEDEKTKQTEVITRVDEFRHFKKLDENSWYIKLSDDKRPAAGRQESEIELALEAIEDGEVSSPVSEMEIAEKPILQQVVFEIKTINLMIESGGVSSIPLIKFNSNLLTNFVNYEQLDLKMQMYFEYYNETKFAWEPIIDIIDKNQWDFKVKLQFVPKKQNKNQKQTLITFDSDRRLEITLSNVALSIFKSLSLSFAKAVNQPEVLSKEEQMIIVKNSTEMTLFFYVDTTKLKCKETNVDPKKLENAFTLVTLKPFSTLSLLPLTKDAIDATSILNYSFIVNYKEYNRSFPLLSNERSVNVIYSNIYPGRNYTYIIDASSRDKQTRYIHFYSNVIVHNHLKMSVGVYSFDEQKETPEKVGTIKSNDKLYLPIGLVYNNDNPYVYIRPTENYLLPVNALIWRPPELDRCKANKKTYKTLHCEPIDKERDQAIYIRSAHYLEKVRIEHCDENEESSFDDLHHFDLYPQFVIRNLLPIELTYRTSRDQLEGIKLRAGADDHVIDIRSKNSELRLDILNYNHKSWYCLKTNFRWPKEDSTEVWEFQSSALTRDTLLLAVSFMNSDENGFRLLTVLAPFWMVNHTGLRLKYSLGDDLYITHEPKEDQVCLVSYKQRQITQKKTMQLALENSKFSDQFPVDAVGSKGSIVVKMHDNSLCFFTINISLSEMLFSKIVKITAFYTIVSRVNFDIEISENRIEWIKLKCKSSQPLYPKDNDRACLFLRLPGKPKCSKAVSLKYTALTVLEVNDVVVCCHVEVTNHGVVIEIVNYYAGCSPALLVNCLEDDYLDYGQKGEEDRFRLPPLSMVHYNWKEPTGFRTLIWSTTQSNEVENDLDKDSFGETLTGGICWVNFYDDNQRIMLITKNKKAMNKIFNAGDVLDPDLRLIANINGLGISMVNSSILKEICYFSISSSDVIWESRKSHSKVFKGFVGKDIELLEAAYQQHRINRRSGSPSSTDVNRCTQITSNLIVNFDRMRILKPHAGELRRTCLNGVYLNMSQSEKMINVHLKMNRIQIDNQLDDHVFATILCPVPPPKSVRMDFIPKPFVEFSTIIQFNNNRRRFKYLSFLIQEFAVQVDLDFITVLQAYVEPVLKKSSTKYEELINNSVQFALKSEINLEQGSSSKHFYDSIHLSPLKIHLSFSLGTIDTLNLPGILDYILKSAGVTLIEFKDAVLKINCFERRNTNYTDDEFVNDLVEHYKAAALSQFYVIVFGLDVLGNPVGLLLGVKQGFTDLFYEPALGIVQGPEEFAEGLVLGVRSLFSSTVGGVAGAFSKITGTLGEGVSSLMEQSERKKRRERLNKNAGLIQNSKNLARGFLSGVTGLVSKPMEGVKKEGFEGLIKGVGHGVVGLVAQPTTGIIDFTSGTLNQLQRTVNINDEVKRIRLARAIHMDGILTSYNSHEAEGRQMLKNLKTALHNDIYVSHCLVARDRYCMITNKHVLYLKKDCLSKSFDVSWHLENSNISKIEVQSNVLLLHLKVCVFLESLY